MSLRRTFLLLGVVLLVGTSLAFKKGDKGRSLRKKEDEKKSPSVTKTEDVRVEIVSKPSECKQKSKLGDQITLHYTGRLESGQIFDSSRERDPFAFRLGAGQVIPAWDRGLVGACEKEKRKLVCPPSLAYGSAGYPPVISGDATLYFEVEVLSINATR